MDNYFRYFAEIIKAASTSPLGVLALIILIIGVLAYFFFRHERVAIKLTVFFTLVGLSLVSFATSFYNTEIFIPIEEHITDAGEKGESESSGQTTTSLSSPPSRPAVAMAPTARTAPATEPRPSSNGRTLGPSSARIPRSTTIAFPSPAERIARSRIALSEEAASTPIRQDCGTASSDWVDIDKGVDNPCPEGCKLGDELGKRIRMVGFPPRPQAKHKFQCWK